MARLSLYLTESHASVTVELGASRQTTARDMVSTLQAMPAEDRAVLVAFCKAVLRWEHLGPTAAAADFHALPGGQS